MGKVHKVEAGHQATTVPCGRLQCTPPGREPDGLSPLTPELKGFIERVIVPILVKEYLAITESEIDLAWYDSEGAHCLGSSTGPKAGEALKP